MAQITLRNYLQETEDAISSKRVDEALASCQYVLAFFPESLEAQRLLGEVYLAQEKLEDAQQSFDWVLTNDPENVIAYCSRALVSERMSDYDTALDCYQQAYELSRGNGQIRQAFNQLSEKVGQPGFMFSRAGLARLYMRGDLLTQAAQEWDTVLAITPDRLDARTGLLEVYWRQGLYDRAAQLAEQILQDVPGCLKALLILAFVTAPQDMFRSKDLIKQVEALDPDLVMGHDLFADHLNRYPNDPFLKLLRKSPATLGTADQATKVASAQSASAINQLNAAGSPISADSLSSWGSNASWNNDETLLKSRSSEPVLKADTPSQSSTWGSESWSGIGKPLAESKPTSSDDLTEQAEPWQLLQNALHNISPDVVRQGSNPGIADANATPWLGADSFSSISQAPESSPQNVSDAGVDLHDSSAPSDEQSWSFAIPEEAKNNNAAPAWLSQLTNNEKQALQDQPLVEPSAPVADPFIIKPTSPSPVQQPATQAPAQPAVSQSGTEALTSKPDAPKPEKPVPAQQQAEPEAMPDWARMMQSDGDEASDEESFFGPDWLKSLGATSLDGTGEFFKLTDESEQPAPQKANNTVSDPEPLAPALEQPEITPEQQKTSSSPAWEQPVEQPKTESNPSWTQPAVLQDAPKAQAFHDPSWLLEPGPQVTKESNPSWEQNQVELPSMNQSSQGQLEDWQQSLPAAHNQSTEATQSAQENDPWQSWQSSHAQPQQDANQLWSDPSQPPAAGQEYWSSSSQAQQDAKESDQPSWMQQLSQSSSTSSSNQGYDDWAASLAPSSSQQPEQVWNDSEAVVQKPEISAHPQLHEGVSDEVTSVSEDPWAKLNQQLQSQAVDYDWLSQLAGNSQAGIESGQSASALAGVGPQSDKQQDETEQNILTTLEDLEQKLFSRGFTPLEPNSLASIAQAQEQQSASTGEPEQEVQPDADSEPSLSSALAELGNFFPHPANSSGSTANPYPASATESTLNQQSGVEPSWLAALNTVPAQQVAEDAPISALDVREQSTEPSWLTALNTAPAQQVAEDAPMSASQDRSHQEPVVETSWLAALNTVPSTPAAPLSEKPVDGAAAMQPVVHVPAKNRETDNISVEPPVTPLLQADPNFQASNRVSVEPMQAPVARINPLLDSELETTMKRPAIRLQPMHQQRTAGPRESGSSGAINRSRAGERVAPRQTDGGNNLSQRERLIRGYQAQLIGDFDNAMQEYRVIIRNAPELLGEVVSNVRALLKLAPNYSAGYRVLGDAYMRQGEYLQAMEAYNKALTMAKKAKG